MVLNSHRLFFLKPWNHTVFVSTRYHVWLFSGGFSLTVPFTIHCPFSPTPACWGLCSCILQSDENGETHKSYHSLLSPAMKLGACLAFRRWIGCKESWNSCWACNSPEKELLCKREGLTLSLQKPSKARWENPHPLSIQCFWDAAEVSTFDGGRVIFGHSWVRESGTRMCVCSCVHMHTHTNK